MSSMCVAWQERLDEIVLHLASLLAPHLRLIESMMCCGSEKLRSARVLKVHMTVLSMGGLWYTVRPLRSRRDTCHWSSRWCMQDAHASAMRGPGIWAINVTEVNSVARLHVVLSLLGYKHFSVRGTPIIVWGYSNFLPKSTHQGVSKPLPDLASGVVKDLSLEIEEYQELHFQGLLANR